MENSKNSSLSKLIPVMLCFFAMGFVDLVGIASNYVKADLGLSDSQANIFPSLVFFWFLIFSVPTGMLMSRIGQKKTVLLSLIVTFASLLLPVFGDSYMLMLISFSLLGIGNALMQTSLNPLLSNIVRGDRLASSLTFGQFVKAIASFLAPYIAMWGATQAIPTFDLGWRILFPIYMIVAVIAILLLNVTQIEEEKEEGKPSTFGQCIALLGKPLIMTCCFLEQFQTKAEMLLIPLFISTKMIIQNYWWILTLAVSCILIRMIRVVLWYIAGLLAEATDSVDTLKEQDISIRSVHRELYQVL